MDSERKTVTVELEVPEPQSVSVDPRKTALVIVDMENDFCRAEGSNPPTTRAVAVIQPIQRLLQRCREMGIEVIYVQSIRDPHSPELVIFGHHPFVMRGTWGSQIIAELMPLPGEPVIEKNSHDCFCRTRMEHLLAEKGIDASTWTIIVTGLGLTNCAGCAISGFSVRQYRVMVPMDCTASRTWEEELCQYQRFLQRGYSYNVTLTRSDLIEIALPLAQVEDSFVRGVAK